MKIPDTFWAGVVVTGALHWLAVIIEWTDIWPWVGYGALFVALAITAYNVEGRPEDAPVNVSVNTKQVDQATEALWRADVWGSGLNRYEDMALIAFRAADISVNSKRDRRL